MNIVLIRHPETLWNLEKRLQGRLEGPITGSAKLEVAKLVSSWKWEPYVIMHGQNERTKFLAKAFGKKYKLVPQETYLLNERDFGKFEGKTSEEIKHLQEDFDPTNYESRIIWKPPGGESIAEVIMRTNRVIDLIYNQKQENVLLVTSGVFIRSFLYNIGEIDKEQLFNLKPNPLQHFLVSI